MLNDPTAGGTCKVHGYHGQSKCPVSGCLPFIAENITRTMSKIYIGIDNGVSGALAAINEHSQVIGYIPMPIQKARKGNEIDPLQVWAWMNVITGNNRENLVVIIEEPGGSKSAKACGSMAGSFHTLRTIVTMKGIRWHRITPMKWQKDMLPGCKSGDTKPRALELANRLWPAERFMASDRCRTAHDGMVDAALIAEWGRQKGI